MRQAAPDTLSLSRDCRSSHSAQQYVLTTRSNTLSRRGEGRVWDLGAQRIFSARRRKISLPGAKNRRQALRSHTPALSHSGEGVNLFASAFPLPSEKIGP